VLALYALVYGVPQPIKTIQRTVQTYSQHQDGIHIWDNAYRIDLKIPHGAGNSRNFRPRFALRIIMYDLYQDKVFRT
jgi:hypothetical protein